MEIFPCGFADFGKVFQNYLTSFLLVRENFAQSCMSAMVQKG